MRTDSLALEEALKSKDVVEKLHILNEQWVVQEFFKKFPKLHAAVRASSKLCQTAVASLIVLGQGPVVFQNRDLNARDKNDWEELKYTLEQLEDSYEAIGGVLGYHLTVLQLISGKTKSVSTKYSRLLHPKGISLAEDTPQVRRAVRHGVESLPHFAEMYPVGGAGDRLMLEDEATGEPLPAAVLAFGGRSLLEGLIRDLQGREYLHFKLCGVQVTTPIAMMTSYEKSNDAHIKAICKKHRWFGRRQENFCFFTQPSVPVITREREWAMTKRLKPLLKPGGHGMIWMLALEHGVFPFFRNKGRDTLLVRQINNPVAGVDLGLTAFAGIGSQHRYHFGFASCPRVLQTPEGMDVVIERATEGGYEYCLTNIEYTDFAQRGIEDKPEKEGSPYSAFPSNTNILFADLDELERVVKRHPIPGMLINMKTKGTFLDSRGTRKEIEAARLESTMQNIADAMIDRFPRKLEGDELDQLKTFITFNARRKTLSVTKASYEPGRELGGTPEGCLFEMMLNAHELLEGYCGMELPSPGDAESFLTKGPPFIFWYHPALGPLYKVIAQKIRGGSLAWGSELHLELAELNMHNVRLEGSLRIIAENPLGSWNGDRIEFGSGNGKCTLKNVAIKNQGVDREAKNIYWKNAVTRKEECCVVLRGNAEFIAEDIALEGHHQIEVPSGYRVRAVKKGRGITFEREHISKPAWTWKYSFDAKDDIVLKKECGVPPHSSN